MNLINEIFEILKSANEYYIVPLILSFILVPLCKKIGYFLGIYAQENSRTVHSGKIVRIGGLAIYLSFMISLVLVIEVDTTFLAIVIGGFVVFIGGLIDDIFNIKPLLKVAFQLSGALIAIYFGDINLNQITIPFIFIDTSSISIIISLVWIIGVSNAINLIDGLDGLSGGISFIILVVIACIGFFMGRLDSSMISTVLAFSILGFLPYNFFPASIFMGDCGALFIGYMIACISLLGFKTSAFITLGFPIVILAVPLADTALAIIRRKIKGQRISEADKEHLHHVLMLKMGLSHRITVLVLYLVTALFGISALLTFYNKTLGILMLGLLSFLAWIFIEATGMINSKFHPLIGLSRRLTKHPKKRENAIFVANKIEIKK